MTRITNKQDIVTFLTAGRAEFTLESNNTATHFTFKITKSDTHYRYFVNYLNGPDSYGYAGMINELTGLKFYTTQKSPKKDTPVIRAINWFINQLDHGTKLDQVEFHHIGRCGRCGRKLTTPESIRTGLGPVCASKSH